MKVKTSITLSEDILDIIDKLSGKRKNRSELIEEAVREYVERQARRKRDLEDLAILDGKIDDFNREAKDVLSYQAEL